MVERRSITSKVAQLRDYMKILEWIRKKAELKTFIADFKIHGLAERYIHLAIENVLDICDTIIAQKEFRKPESYHDNILILVENKILPKKFGENFAKIAGFRNILVHNYISLDHAKVFEYLQNDLDDFKKFLKYIVPFMQI